MALRGHDVDSVETLRIEAQSGVSLQSFTGSGYNARAVGVLPHERLSVRAPQNAASNSHHDRGYNDVLCEAPSRRRATNRDEHGRRRD
jgi:hypothetical protein